MPRRERPEGDQRWAGILRRARHGVLETLRSGQESQAERTLVTG